MCRWNLSAAEETKALARRKAIYEAMHPETKHGATGGGRDGKGTRRKTGVDNLATPVSFADDTSAKTGRSARSVRRDVALGAKLADEAVKPLGERQDRQPRQEIA